MKFLLFNIAPSLLSSLHHLFPSWLAFRRRIYYSATKKPTMIIYVITVVCVTGFIFESGFKWLLMSRRWKKIICYKPK